MEAQRIFKRCCQTLEVNQFDSMANRMSIQMAILVADEIVRSYPCGCEYSDKEKQAKKAYYIDVKYELMRL